MEMIQPGAVLSTILMLGASPNKNKKVNFVDVAATVANFMSLPTIGPGKSLL